MWPILMRALRGYAPYITLPAAALVGAIGYNIESYLSDKYTPYSESIQEKRMDRYLEEADSTTVKPLKEKAFVPPTIFEKNVSPSLKGKD